jgi:hypothetical protein
MQRVSSQRAGRHGITVLGLLLLIIAIVIAIIFLTRYLRDRPVVSVGVSAGVTSSAV